MFPLGSALEKHTDKCMDKLQYKAQECPDCKNTFLTKKALKSHITKHNNNTTKYACSHNKMIILTETELKNHEMRCISEVQHGIKRAKKFVNIGGEEIAHVEIPVFSAMWVINPQKALEISQQK